ncbi:MAG: tetratricopeptide repeat protein [Bryobacterales bacterium]|nr:tetratricopeptide repeat protein [Bryobacterales bacterium]
MTPEARGRRRAGQNDVATRLNDQAYYQALALRKLGKDTEAKQKFEALLAFGQQSLKTPAAAPANAAARREERVSPRLRTASAYYLTGLARLGLDRKAEAKAAFTKAVESSPDHLAARMALAAKGGLGGE